MMLFQTCITLFFHLTWNDSLSHIHSQRIFFPYSESEWWLRLSKESKSCRFETNDHYLQYSHLRCITFCGSSELHSLEGWTEAKYCPHIFTQYFTVFGGDFFFHQWSEWIKCKICYCTKKLNFLLYSCNGRLCTHCSYSEYGCHSSTVFAQSTLTSEFHILQLNSINSDSRI